MEMLLENYSINTEEIIRVILLNANSGQLTILKKNDKSSRNNWLSYNYHLIPLFVNCKYLSKNMKMLKQVEN